MPVAAIAASIGGNVRVGLEDSLWIGAGKLAVSNAEGTYYRYVKLMLLDEKKG